MNPIYIYIYIFNFERKLEFANSFEDIYIWKVGIVPPKEAMAPLDFYF